MNDLERAVVEAAIAYWLNGDESVDFHNDLADKVDALIKHRGPDISPEDFGRELKEQGHSRAANSFLREWQKSQKRFDFAGEQHWPKIRTLRDFADLGPGYIIDSHQTGPKTWGAWAELLRKHGLEPVWATVFKEGEGS